MHKYIKGKELGRGGFGAAYIVSVKANPSQQYVLKEVKISHMGRREQDNAKKEAEFLKGLHHPNIVTHVESFVHLGNLCIVMGYADGGDLAAKVKSRRQAKRALSEDEVMNIFVQICLALKHVHDRRILHRDLKSQNVFLTKKGMVKVGDFGIAKELDSTVGMARTQIGTPYYLSPEICQDKPYDRKSDIWALGCLLYEMLALRVPFEARELPSLVRKIMSAPTPAVPRMYSSEAHALVKLMLQKNPARRPTINELLARPYLQGRMRRFLSETLAVREFGTPLKGLGGDEEREGSDEEGAGGGAGGAPAHEEAEAKAKEEAEARREAARRKAARQAERDRLRLKMAEKAMAREEEREEERRRKRELNQIEREKWLAREKEAEKALEAERERRVAAAREERIKARAAADRREVERANAERERAKAEWARRQDEARRNRQQAEMGLYGVARPSRGAAPAGDDGDDSDAHTARVRRAQAARQQQADDDYAEARRRAFFEAQEHARRNKERVNRDLGRHEGGEAAPNAAAGDGRGARGGADGQARASAHDVRARAKQRREAEQAAYEEQLREAARAQRREAIALREKMRRLASGDGDADGAPDDDAERERKAEEAAAAREARREAAAKQEADEVDRLKRAARESYLERKRLQEQRRAAEAAERAESEARRAEAERGGGSVVVVGDAGDLQGAAERARRRRSGSGSGAPSAAEAEAAQLDELAKARREHYLERKALQEKMRAALATSPKGEREAPASGGGGDRRGAAAAVKASARDRKERQRAEHEERMKAAAAEAARERRALEAKMKRLAARMETAPLDVSAEEEESLDSTHAVAGDGRAVGQAGDILAAAEARQAAIARGDDAAGLKGLIEGSRRDREARQEYARKLLAEAGDDPDVAAAAGGQHSISRGSELSEVSDDIVEGARADVRAWLESALDPAEVKTLEADDETMAEAVHEIDVQQMAEELRDVLSMDGEEVALADGDDWDGAAGSGGVVGDDVDETGLDDTLDEAAVSAAVAAAASAVLAEGGDLALPGAEDADDAGDGDAAAQTVATRLPTPPPMDGAFSEGDDLERLRIYLEEQLGDSMLLRVYRYMKDSEEAHVNEAERNAQVVDILGSAKQASRFSPLVQRLIDLEEMGF